MSETLFVCLMGLGTVFTGLICIVILCTVMSAIIRATLKNKTAPAVTETKADTAAEIPDRQKMIAAVSAALAEELGTDVEAIRILSFKRL